MSTATAEQGTATNEITLERVVALAQRLAPADQARLVERLAPALVQALAEERPQPRRSLLGVAAHLGPAPSAEDIDEVRKEMWANFPREDI